MFNLQMGERKEKNVLPGVSLSQKLLNIHIKYLISSEVHLFVAGSLIRKSMPLLNLCPN